MTAAPYSTHLTCIFIKAGPQVTKSLSRTPRIIFATIFEFCQNVSNDELPSNVPNFKVGDVGREFVLGTLRNSVGPPTALRLPPTTRRWSLGTIRLPFTTLRRLRRISMALRWSLGALRLPPAALRWPSDGPPTPSDFNFATLSPKSDNCIITF